MIKGEIEYKVDTIRVSKKCDKCNKGELQFTGKNSLATNPPQFLHVCNSCGNEVYISGIFYPYIRYRKFQ